MGQRLALMQAVGLLPLDLGLLRKEVGVRQVAEETFGALEWRSVGRPVPGGRPKAPSHARAST
jgi:hypothetical protein